MARQILLLGLILLVLIPVCAETEKIESSLKSIQGIYINAESVFAPDGATLSYGNTYTLEEGDTQTVFGTTVEVEVISDDCEVRIEINGEDYDVSSALKQCESIHASAISCSDNTTTMFLGKQKYLSKGESVTYSNKKITLLKVSESGYILVNVVDLSSGDEDEDEDDDSSQLPQVDHCIDSDGSDFNKKGTVTSPVNGIKTDTCHKKGGKGVADKDVAGCSGSSCYIIEWLCDEDDKAVKANEYQCDCEEGACVTSDTSQGTSGTEDTGLSLWEQFTNWLKDVFG